jgi:hypothetical protein
MNIFNEKFEITNMFDDNIDLHVFQSSGFISWFLLKTVCATGF